MINLFKKKEQQLNKITDVVAYDIYRKCTRVIDSCISTVQLNTAVQYCNLYLKLEPNIKDVGPLLEKYCDEKFKNLQHRY